MSVLVRMSATATSLSAPMTATLSYGTAWETSLHRRHPSGRSSTAALRAWACRSSSPTETLAAPSCVGDHEKGKRLIKAACVCRAADIQNIRHPVLVQTWGTDYCETV